MNIYVFLGPPGVGKGSLSKLCVEKLGWQQLSTGNLCRMHIANQTDIGKKIDFIIKSGKLVPDDVITEMVSDWLIKNYDSNRTIILDGFPRTVIQAKAIDDLLKEKFPGSKINVVKLIIPEKTVISRLTSRLICGNSKCQAVYSTMTKALAPKDINVCDKCSCKLIKRQDDNEQSIKERLAVYNEHENELLKYYSKNQKILDLNVEKNLDEVFEDFKKLINLK